MRGEQIRAAVISDTHGLLRPEVEQVLSTCDVVIHGGDFSDQMLYHRLNTRQPLYAVRGNNDNGWAEGLPLIRRFSLAGVRFIMAHDRADIPRDLKDEQVVLFGHSHKYYQQAEGGRLWLNPGSCGYKRFTLPLSMAVMTLRDGAYQVEPIWLDEEYGKSREDAERKAGEEEGKKDQLFLIAKIMRFMKKGAKISWVADNLEVEPAFVGIVYQIVAACPGADARLVLAALVGGRAVGGGSG